MERLGIGSKTFSIKFSEDWIKNRNIILEEIFPEDSRAVPRYFTPYKWEFPVIYYEGKFYNLDRTKEVGASGRYYIYTTKREDLRGLTQAEQYYINNFLVKL